MKQFRLIFVLGLLFCNISFATDIMPLSEIKEGMTGVGRTVFKGSQIEEFQVEILGVLKNYLPQQNLILGMLKGGNLEETGVIAGMSGSPVYINGKMIGAVAYSWPFAKTPIAGITPIESMLKAQALPAEQPPQAPPLEVANYYNFENLITNHFQDAQKVSTSLPQFGQVQLTPIAAPLTVSGFEPRILDRFTPLFSALGMQPVQGGASAGSTTDKLPPNLDPGSPVSVQLIQGDFDIGAIGTVTYRNQDKVLAFGHPFYNLGPINFPMATAQIYAVVPSLYSSFKVGSAGSVVGSVKQDLHSAIMGVMGSPSPMIPVTVKMNDGDEKERTFHFELANHKLLAPILLDFAFQNSILVTQLGYSESTLKVNGVIGVKGRAPVVIGNIFSGAGSFQSASQYVASVLYALMTNEFQNLDVQDVHIDVETAMKRNESELMEVWLDRNEVRPGETVKLKAMYRPLQGEKKFEEFSIKIPDDVQLSQLYF
ncbi:MAG TPA: SpoIVB peptidase S55 domain-containing protein, partial [Acidobacteriota bacterium]